VLPIASRNAVFTAVATSATPNKAAPNGPQGA